jgi:hypothetical protein
MKVNSHAATSAGGAGGARTGAGAGRASGDGAHAVPHLMLFALPEVVADSQFSWALFLLTDPALQLLLQSLLADRLGELLRSVLVTPGLSAASMGTGTTGGTGGSGNGKQAVVLPVDDQVCSLCTQLLQLPVVAAATIPATTTTSTTTATATATAAAAAMPSTTVTVCSSPVSAAVSLHLPVLNDNLLRCLIPLLMVQTVNSIHGNTIAASGGGEGGSDVVAGQWQALIQHLQTLLQKAAKHVCGDSLSASTGPIFRQWHSSV